MRPHVYLIGMMGAGKTSVGPLVARARAMEFVDLDALLEEKSGRSIARWFAEAGEAEFRLAERHWLQQPVRHPTVFATGGGAPTYGDNLETMRANGRVIYLHAHPIVLSRRLEGGVRPLLVGARNEVDRVGRLATILDERAPIYARADVTIDTEGCSLDEVAARVVAALGAP